MNERKPVCLAIGAVYPVTFTLYYVIASIFVHREPYPNGGLPANYGLGLLLLAIFSILFLVGLPCTIASLARKEKHRNWALVCLAVYILPVLFFLWEWWRAAELSK